MKEKIVEWLKGKGSRVKAFFKKARLPKLRREKPVDYDPFEVLPQIEEKAPMGTSTKMSIVYPKLLKTSRILAIILLFVHIVLGMICISIVWPLSIFFFLSAYICLGYLKHTGRT